jgi:hypothetical protein
MAKRMPDQLAFDDDELVLSDEQFVARPRLSKVTIAWLTGLYEGEGNVNIAKNGGVRITIRMTDRDVIERLHSIFPCTKIHVVPAQRANWKTQYAWRISNPDNVRTILELMLPLLGKRRAADARAALEYLRTRPGSGGRQREKTHCPQDHEYTPENTKIDKWGRNCRTCQREWSRQNRRKTKTVARLCDPLFTAVDVHPRAPADPPDAGQA